MQRRRRIGRAPCSRDPFCEQKQWKINRVAEGSLTKKLSSVKLSSIIITSVTISTSVIGDRGEREGREERGQGREREGERGEEGGGFFYDPKDFVRLESHAREGSPGRS
jgi:hypothetical protein